MSTPTTTIAAITANLETLMRGLIPASVRGERFEEHDRTVLDDWADANPGACFRRFQVRMVGEGEPPAITGNVELREAIIRVSVAYPHSNARYGLNNLRDMDRIIEEDLRHLRGTGGLGISNPGGYVSGQCGSVVTEWEIDELENVSILRVTLLVTYYRATAQALSLDGYPTSGVELMRMLDMVGGTAPDALWRCDATDSWADLSPNGYTLTQSGTAPTLVTSNQLGGVTAVRFASGADTVFSAANNTILDVAGESVCILAVCVTNTFPASGRDDVAGKVGTNYYRLEAFGGTDNYRASLYDGVGFLTRSSAGSQEGNPVAQMAGADYTIATNGGAWVASNDSARSEGEAAAALGSLTNTGTFGVGHVGQSASGMDIAMVAVWTGAAAEQGFTQAKLQSLATELGLT